MMIPDGYKDMTDDQVLQKLLEYYDGDKVVARYILDVIRGRVEPLQPLR